MLPLAITTWGDEEKKAILDVVESGNYTMGEKVSQYERDYAQYVGSEYCVSVNSGSSANLLMVAALSLRAGVGEVIVPAVSWSTSFSPFMQWGWRFKFVDVDDSFNINPEAIKEVYQGHELILGVNLLGNPCDYKLFPSMAILEDNCESMGAEYEGVKTGRFGVMSSHSTYFSHHIQTMEGGLITTDDEYFYQMLLCLRSHGWTRHLPEDNVLNARVSAYEFLYPGYNVRPIEMQGAIGIEQVKKLPAFIEQRKENAERFKEKAKEKGWQIQKENGDSSWFAFGILSEDPETKAELSAKGIEHRPLVAGNFTKSPSIDYYDYTFGDLPKADYIHEHGFYIGNNHKPIDWSIL